MVILIWETLPYRMLPPPNIPGIKCVGLGWDSTEKLAIWLVYRSPNAPAEALSGLLEAATTWRLQYPKTIILGDFNIHADKPSSKQTADLISSMETLGFS